MHIFAPLEGNAAYTTPGGYNKYCTDLETMTRTYRETEGKGVKAEEVLKVYLDGKVTLGQTILAADWSLSEAEQKAKEEEALRKQAEQEGHAIKEKLKIQKRLGEDRERTYQQHVNQLMEKMEADRRQAKAEYERVLQAKLEEQSDLLQQGFDGRARQLQREIDQIKGDRRAMEEESPTFFDKAVSTVKSWFSWF